MLCEDLVKILGGQIADRAIRSRNSPSLLLLAVVFCGAAGPSMCSEEAVVFTKDLGDGLSLIVVPRQEKIEHHALTAEEEKARKDAGMEWIEEGVYTAKEVCSFRLLGKGMPTKGRTLLEQTVKCVGGMETSGGFRIPIFECNTYKIYDVARTKGRFYVLMHHGFGNMWLKWAEVNDAFEVKGDWNEAHLFGRFWKRANDGFFPIKRAQVIPAGDRVYAFFAGKSGKCMLWEIQGKEAKMVWESKTAPQEEPEAKRP